ncbi:hypothetical protein [Streptomyces sp. NPDC049813]
MPRLTLRIRRSAALAVALLAGGTAYVVDKSGAGPATEDQVTRFRVR